MAVEMRASQALKTAGKCYMVRLAPRPDNWHVLVRNADAGLAGFDLPFRADRPAVANVG